MAFEVPVELAADDFVAFVGRYDTSQYPDQYAHLQDYLASWLEEGHAVEQTGGNFETYLQVALRIADMVFENPSVLDYASYRKIHNPDAYARHPVTDDYERRITGIIDHEQSGYPAFDKRYYEVVKFRLENRGKGFLGQETGSLRLPGPAKE